MYNVKSFNRGAGIVDYILEDSSNTLEGAAKEYKISTSTARRDMEYFEMEAFKNERPNSKELQMKYLKAKVQLRKNMNNGRKKAK